MLNERNLEILENKGSLPTSSSPLKFLMEHNGFHEMQYLFWLYEQVWYNNKGWPAVVSYMNVMNNMILRSQLPPFKSPAEYGITTENHPMNLTSTQSNSNVK